MLGFVRASAGTCAGLMLSLGSAATAHAGTIIFDSFTGPGNVQVNLLSTLDPANDNTGSTLNLVSMTKTFGGLDPIDTVFTISNDGGTTEYQLLESITNLTGTEWTGYDVFLGFGTGEEFVLSALDDGLDFDFPHQDPGAAASAEVVPFAVAQAFEDQLSFQDGGIPSGSAFGLVFQIDVPDDIASFTIRQLPQIAVVIPEPAAGALLGLSLALLATLRRYRTPPS